MIWSELPRVSPKLYYERSAKCKFFFAAVNSYITIAPKFWPVQGTCLMVFARAFVVQLSLIEIPATLTIRSVMPSHQPNLLKAVVQYNNPSRLYGSDGSYVNY